MARRYHITEGALTSAGGVVVSGSHLVRIDGKPMALEGDLCSCGCSPAPVLMPIQSLRFQTVEGSGAAGGEVGRETNPARMANAVSREPVKFDEQIRFFLPDRNVLANTPYKLMLADGTEREGKTDNSGRTQRIVTNEPTEIVCAEFYPEVMYGCECHIEQACAAGGRAPVPLTRVYLGGVITNPNAIDASLVSHTIAATVRGMTAGEIAMAKTVFRDAIDYSKVKIHKGGLMGMPNRSQRGEHGKRNSKHATTFAWFVSARRAPAMTLPCPVEACITLTSG